MLILTRLPGETIVIRSPLGEILLTVLAVRPGGVRLGLEAPPEIGIHRAEHPDCPPRKEAPRGE